MNIEIKPIGVEEFKSKLSKAKEIKIIATEEQTKEILIKSGYGIDKDGLLVDEEGEKIRAIDEREIKPKEMGSLLAGSNVFIRRNIASFSKFAMEEIKNK